MTRLPRSANGRSAGSLPRRAARSAGVVTSTTGRTSNGSYAASIHSPDTRRKRLSPTRRSAPRKRIIPSSTGDGRRGGSAAEGVGAMATAGGRPVDGRGAGSAAAAGTNGVSVTADAVGAGSVRRDENCSTLATVATAIVAAIGSQMRGQTVTALGRAARSAVSASPVVTFTYSASATLQSPHRARCDTTAERSSLSSVPSI